MAYKNVDSMACETSYDEAYLEPDSCDMSLRIKEFNAQTIEADPRLCGLSGSPTKVKKIDNVVLTAGEARQIPNTEAGISELVHELIEEHIIG